MSDDSRGDGPNNTPAAPAGQPAPAQAPTQLLLNAQYIKDLSFESPRAPQILLQPVQPTVDVNVDVRARNLAPQRDARRRISAVVDQPDRFCRAAAPPADRSRTPGYCGRDRRLGLTAVTRRPATMAR